MAFSASDAAFEGFRLARERPVAIAYWSVVFFAYNLLSSAVLIAMAGGALDEFMDISQTGAAADPQRMMELVLALAPANLAAWGMTLLVYAVLFAAVARAVLRPAESAHGYLRLGRDELRQFIVLAALFLISLGVLTIATALVSFAATIVGAASAPAGGLLTALGMIGLIVALLWIWGRLSLAGPMTLDTGRVSLKEAWLMTRGRGWTMFGALFLAFVLAVIVGLLCLLIFVAVAAVTFGGIEAATAVFSPDFSSLGGYFTPVMIVYNAVAAVVNVLTLAILVGVGARAYAELRAAPTA